MLGYVQQELIPKLMLKREALSGLFDDKGDDAADVVGVTADNIVPQPPTNNALFLQWWYVLFLISIATMARWMHACVFRYKKPEKHYFVDGHKRPETIAYRPVFTRKYLAYKVRAHRWIQVTLEESNALLLVALATKQMTVLTWLNTMSMQPTFLMNDSVYFLSEAT
jgi:hypothetical protein